MPLPHMHTPRPRVWKHICVGCLHNTKKGEKDWVVLIVLSIKKTGLQQFMPCTILYYKYTMFLLCRQSSVEFFGGGEITVWTRQPGTLPASWRRKLTILIAPSYSLFLRKCSVSLVECVCMHVPHLHVPCAGVCAFSVINVNCSGGLSPRSSHWVRVHLCHIFTNQLAALPLPSFPS